MEQWLAVCIIECLSCARRTVGHLSVCVWETKRRFPRFAQRDSCSSGDTSCGPSDLILLSAGEREKLPLEGARGGLIGGEILIRPAECALNLLQFEEQSPELSSFSRAPKDGNDDGPTLPNATETSSRGMNATMSALCWNQSSIRRARPNEPTGG